MNRLEFYKVIEAMNINHILPTGIKNTYYNLEDVYFWNNLKIYFSGTNYAIVYGKIPLEVMNIIYKKYHESKYGIIIHDGIVDEIPVKHTTDNTADKEYEISIQYGTKNNLESNKISNTLQKVKRFLKRKNDKEYISTYHIYTKEGLLLFLLEINYYLKNNNMKEERAKKYEQLITEINYELIKEIISSISAFNCKQTIEEKDNYNMQFSKIYKTKAEQILRKVILDFDKAVNPFFNEDIKLNEILKYLQGSNTNIQLFGSLNNDNLIITNSNTSNKTCYYRKKNSFSFQLMYNFNDKKKLEVIHYYTTTSNDKIDKREIIAIKYYGYNVENEINMRLNITNGKVESSNSISSLVTKEQISYIYDELIKATICALSITNPYNEEKAKENEYNVSKKKRIHTKKY